MSESKKENSRKKFKAALERKNLNSQSDKKNIVRSDKGIRESRGNNPRLFRRKSG